MDCKQDEPLISVLIAAHAAHGTIARAVASLVAQTLDDWEAVVISDDGTDYAPTLDAAGLADPRVRFTSTGRIRSGPAAARNAGLATARGHLIARLDADDLYLPARLERLAPIARARGAAADNGQIVRDQDGASMGTLFAPDAAQDSGIVTLDLDRLLATSAPLSFVVRRERMPAWDSALRLCDDFLFALRLIDAIGPVPVLSTPLHEYRVRQGSVCHADDSATVARADYRYVLERLGSDGYGFADPGRRAAIIRAVQAKSDLNDAYEAAYRQGRARDFQDFISRRQADWT